MVNRARGTCYAKKEGTLFRNVISCKFGLLWILETNIEGWERNEREWME